MRLVKVLSIHVNDVVLLDLASDLTRVLVLLAIASQSGFHEEILEKGLQRLTLLVIEALINTCDAHLLVLPHNLLIVLLVVGHVYHLLLDLSKDLNADGLCSRLLKVPQDVNLCLYNHWKVLNKKVHLSLCCVASR